MIEVSADEKALRHITKEIGDLAYKAPTILKEASNDTGKEAMKRMKSQIKKRYAFQHSAISLDEHLKRKSASYANPRTIIEVSGSMNSLADFIVTPRRLSRGNNRVGPYAAHVLSSQSPIGMNRRTFMIRFDSGHIALVERIEGKKYSNQKKISERTAKKLDLTRIEEKRTVSIPHMASGAYDEIEDDISVKLQENIQKYIERFNKQRRVV